MFSPAPPLCILWFTAWRNKLVFSPCTWLGEEISMKRRWEIRIYGECLCGTPLIKHLCWQPWISLLMDLTLTMERTRIQFVAVLCLPPSMLTKRDSFLQVQMLTTSQKFRITHGTCCTKGTETQGWVDNHRKIHHKWKPSIEHQSFVENQVLFHIARWDNHDVIFCIFKGKGPSAKYMCQEEVQQLNSRLQRSDNAKNNGDHQS